MSVASAELPDTFTVKKAEFIEDVGQFMQGKVVDTVIQGFDDQRRKFKMVEQQFVQRKARLIMKQPEIQKALDIVNMLLEQQQQQEMIMDFELAEGVYAKSKLTGVRAVNLWLGAGIMAEYSLQEAKVRAIGCTHTQQLCPCGCRHIAAAGACGLCKVNLYKLHHATP